MIWNLIGTIGGKVLDIVDDRCWSDEGQGVMIKRASYIEQMETAIKDGDPSSAIRMQGLRDLLNENTRTDGWLHECQTVMRQRSKPKFSIFRSAGKTDLINAMSR